MISRLHASPPSDLGDADGNDSTSEPRQPMYASSMSSMDALMRVKHTAELMALCPQETQRALLEIRQSAVLRRFYDAAMEMGLRKERCNGIRTVDELNGVMSRVRWLLASVTWNARRLASISRWLLRSVLCIQRFVRMYIPKLRRRKLSVMIMWRSVLSTAATMLRRQTMAHVQRYRITLMHGAFRDEAFGLVSDILIPDDDVCLAVESIWRLRIDRYREMFRQRQREGRYAMLERLNAMPKHEVPLMEGRHLPRTTSLAASRTLTFRRLRLKRIDFDVPSLLFGAAYVTTAEICVHLHLMKLRQVRDSIALYQQHALGCHNDGTTLMEQASTGAAAAVTPLRVAPLNADELLEFHRLMRLHQTNKTPVTYVHALISVNSQTHWFTLYCLRQLRRHAQHGAVPSTPDVSTLGILGTPPEAMVGELAAAQCIYEAWQRRAMVPVAPSRQGGKAGRSHKQEGVRLSSRSGVASNNATVESLRLCSPTADPSAPSSPPPPSPHAPHARMLTGTFISERRSGQRGAQWAATIPLDTSSVAAPHQASPQGSEEAVWRDALAWHAKLLAKHAASTAPRPHSTSPSPVPRYLRNAAAEQGARRQCYQRPTTVDDSWGITQSLLIKRYALQPAQCGWVRAAPPTSAHRGCARGHAKTSASIDAELAKDLDTLLVTRRVVPAAAAVGVPKPQRPSTAPSRRGCLQ